jgi:hypothetical protein
MYFVAITNQISSQNKTNSRGLWAKNCIRIKGWEIGSARKRKSLDPHKIKKWGGPFDRHLPTFVWFLVDGSTSI